MVKKGNKKMLKQKQSCNICMMRQINCKTVECSHQFCYRCLSKWTRRKGNCPLCRQEIRRIFYKNKVIQPEFLKNFDEEIILSQQIQMVTPRPRLNRIRPIPYMFITPQSFYLYPLQSMASFPSSGFSFVPFLYNTNQ